MGLWDVEDDVEEFLSDTDLEQDRNKYLLDTDQAIGLISKIIGISKRNSANKKSLKKIDSMINGDFLSAFNKIQLTDEAQLQMKLNMLSEKLVEQKKYEILKNKSVVGLGGKFSAGKSKFINSILKAGVELLPEDQNPTTSIPTYIVYGENEEIFAYTSDNEKVTLDVQALEALTHKFFQKYNIGFSSFINSLIISEPDMPYRELVFLDTPGYSKSDLAKSSKKQRNLTDENKAYTQLKNVDYLIWLVDIENGILSESDIEFIRKLNFKAPILVVVNKSDKKTDKEIEQVVGMVELSARNAGLNVFGVTGYSSRNNKEWRNTNLIFEFLEMATKKKFSKDDIRERIKQIKNNLSEELEKKIEDKIEERNSLNDIIFMSVDIKEIRTLVSLYAESMEEIRNMKECRKQFQITIQHLEKELNKLYGGR